MYLNQYKSMCLLCYPYDSMYVNTLIGITGIKISNKIIPAKFGNFWSKFGSILAFGEGFLGC